MAVKTRNPGFNDMKLAGQVRNLALTQIYKILQGDDEEYKKALLLKISTSLLPRLNEHSGPDGANLKISFDPAFNATPQSTETDSQ